jgi:PAS domain S-box-containing protein
VNSRVVSEQELRESEERYRLLTQNSLTGIFIHQDHLFAYVNERLAKIIGRVSLELVGKPFWEFVHPEDRDIFKKKAEERLSGNGKPFHDEFRMVSKDGTTKWVEVLATTVVYRGRSANMGNVADITKRKTAEMALREAHDELEKRVNERTAELSLSNEKLKQEISERLRFEQALHDSEKRYRLLVETARDMIWSMDMDLKFTYVSPSVTAVLGYDIEEILDLGPLDIMTPASRTAFLRVFADQVIIGFIPRTDKFVSQTVEIEQIHKNGATLWTEVTMSHLRDQAGEPVGILAISRDISERKEAAEKLEQALRNSSQLRDAAEAANLAKSEFLANMSHELRTPLNSIIGFSEILGDRTFGALNEKQSKAVRHIVDSGKHLLALINDILDLAKVESGKMSLQISPVKVRLLLENCLSMIEELANRHDFTLALHVSNDLTDAEIDADEMKLKQILINLLSNAAKFTPDGGRITLQAEREGNEIVVRVSDTGIGVRPEDRLRIFEAFEQVDSSYSRLGKGTGLALALTRKLVEIQGGRIWVQSVGAGKGSTFSFLHSGPSIVNSLL